MFAVGAIPPVFLAAAVQAMPESPRWLAMRGRHGDARAVLKCTSDTPAEVDLRLEEIKRAVEAPRPSGASGGVWKELLVRLSASVRRIVICVVGLQFFQHASGIEAIELYSPLVLKKAGMSSDRAVLGATVAVGAVKTGFILVATLLSDSVGRRPLLLGSMAGVAVAQTSLARVLCAGTASALAAPACLA
ncbi:hypothetical protein ACP4OV_002361 [Aristida adscensionis]